MDLFSEDTFTGKLRAFFWGSYGIGHDHSQVGQDQRSPDQGPSQPPGTDAHSNYETQGAEAHRPDVAPFATIKIHAGALTGRCDPDDLVMVIVSLATNPDCHLSSLRRREWESQVACLPWPMCCG